MSDNQVIHSAHLAANFCMEGNISIPIILLKFYKRLNIGEMELVLLLHLISKKQFDNDSYPSCEDIAKYMTIDPMTIKSTIACLIEKGMLLVESKYDLVSGEWINYYSMQGLYVKLADSWLAEHVNEKAKKAESTEKEILSQLYKTYEKEFGRLLSPMEVTQIAEWYKGDKYSPELIFEALKRAVLRNVLNFKYIDSILRDWSRNNIKTAKQAEQHDEKFKDGKSSGKAAQRKGFGKNTLEKIKDEKEKEKYKNFYLS